MSTPRYWTLILFDVLLALYCNYTGCYHWGEPNKTSCKCFTVAVVMVCVSLSLQSVYPRGPVPPYLLMLCLHCVPEAWGFRKIQKLAQAHAVCQKPSWDRNSDPPNCKGHRISMSLPALLCHPSFPIFRPPWADLHLAPIVMGL